MVRAIHQQVGSLQSSLADQDLIAQNVCALNGLASIDFEYDRRTRKDRNPRAIGKDAFGLVADAESELPGQAGGNKRSRGSRVYKRVNLATPHMDWIEKPLFRTLHVSGIREADPHMNFAHFVSLFLGHKGEAILPWRAAYGLPHCRGSGVRIESGIQAESK